MRALTSADARDLQEAVVLAQQARANGQTAMFSAGGSDLLQLVKDHVVEPDVLVNLRTVGGLDEVTSTDEGVRIGGLITLDALSRHPLIRDQFQVLAEAAESVATPQIRNVGTLAGNVCQRPWCWYYRNGFPCFKAGGNQCFSVAGENQLHAIFGGGPSYIVHPSDIAPALVALGATFEVWGSEGEGSLAGSEFFVLPSDNVARENVLGAADILAEVHIPAPRPGTRSSYHKIMEREAWTHAVVSAAVVLEMDEDVCRDARIVLGGVAPVPWRVQEAERLLVGESVSLELAREVGEASVQGARPLSKNAYKVPLLKAVVERTVLSVASSA